MPRPSPTVRRLSSGRSEYVLKGAAPSDLQAVIDERTPQPLSEQMLSDVYASPSKQSGGHRPALRPPDSQLPQSPRVIVERDESLDDARAVPSDAIGLGTAVGQARWMGRLGTRPTVC